MTMAKTDFKSVVEYIDSHPKAVQRVLKRVRRSIRRVLPAAEESISYGLPTYKLSGRPVIYFGGWSRHYSIYPSTDRLVSAFKNELAPYEVSKGTIRFPLSEPVPVELIERIAKFRAQEAAVREKAKAAVPQKRRARVGAPAPSRRTI
jgi:uncharacterized protein YdhG (YjbR/CyaY superfamily)